MTSAEAPERGDELVPEANMVFDRRHVLDATPEEVWPWLVQLGKRRAGWYLPAGIERLLPAPRRATHRIDPAFQGLSVGDRIPDYGGRDEWLEAAVIDPPHALIYASERHGTPFSWALLLAPVGARRTELTLRFRGRLRSTGLRRRLIIAGGGFFDAATGDLMVRGLAQRLGHRGRIGSSSATDQGQS